MELTFNAFLGFKDKPLDVLIDQLPKLFDTPKTEIKWMWDFCNSVNAKYKAAGKVPEQADYVREWERRINTPMGPKLNEAPSTPVMAMQDVDFWRKMQELVDAAMDRLAAKLKG